MSVTTELQVLSVVLSTSDDSTHAHTSYVAVGDVLETVGGDTLGMVCDAALLVYKDDALETCEMALFIDGDDTKEAPCVI